MKKTFSGGIHVPSCKNTRNIPIVDFPAPSKVAIPMQQHIGAPAMPLVKKGDYVKLGQIIGDFKEGLSCPVHASVSGTVLDVEMRNSYNGYGKTAFVVIENDYTNTLSESIVPYTKSLKDITSDEVIEIVKNAGISGMGGASFPTYAKIQSAIGKATEVIINCAECEPYITENHRLMLECPEKIVGGAEILCNAIGAKHITIAVEDNKKNAAKKLKVASKNNPKISVELLKTKYPQGDERQLMYVLTGKELPAGKLPADIGCVIFNTETTIAVFSAVLSGMPLIKTVVTIDGDAVNEPKNVLVPIGVSFGDILEFCGGVKKNVSKIVSGGPMMGNAQWTLDAVVMKNTSAILAFSDDNISKAVPACIHCGKCVSVCPMHLMPNYLAQFSGPDDIEKAQEFNVMSCVECGCCTYTCPGNVPIVQYIRTQKGRINAKRKTQVSKAQK